MALPSTIHKAELNVADMDRHYYAGHSLTIARHPSETEERMMVRLLAFALHAHERLEFGRGLSTTEEPDLWEHDLTGRLAIWIDVGQPDERRLRKACAQAGQVAVYAYGGGRSVDLWWAKAGPGLARHGNLSVFALDPSETAALAALAERTMRLQATIQDGEAWVSSGDARIRVGLRRLHGAA
jgi:uncharacterized protein YaeQ